MALPLLLWEFYSAANKNLRRSLIRSAPYILITVGFYFYHAHFSQSALQSEPLSSEGAHSILAFVRNGAYSIAYCILPLDQQSATTILMQYRIAAFSGGIILLAAFVWFGFRKREKVFTQVLWKPVVFAILTGIVMFFTFERWRLYLPSVGIVTIMVLMFSHVTGRAARALLLACVIPLGGFHIYRALAAQSEWRASTALRDDLKANLSGILSQVPVRPITLGMIAVPAKLGSASVMLLGQDALVTRAEADRISERNRETATTQGTNVTSWSAVDVYALDRSEGFRELQLTRITSNKFLISVPETSAIVLYPANLEDNGNPRRDQKIAVGDSVVTPEFIDIVRSVSNGTAKSVEVHVKDTSAVLLSLTRTGLFERIQ